MFMYLFECHQTAEFVGDVTATNLYTIPQVNDKFTKFYTKYVFGNTQNYYAISNYKSKISLKKYFNFLKKK